MINLLVDEGYAFDYLSILEVKHILDPSNINKKNSFNECVKNIIEQITYSIYIEIKESKEYADLLNANLETFKCVDLAKTDQVKASDVDKANYIRFIKKNELQKRFFKSSCTEIKIGYERYK